MQIYKTVRDFYSSKRWHDCAATYARSKKFLCERCLKAGIFSAGEEVHHKIRLTAENINDASITLNWANLECLCKQCHHEEHKEDARLRYYKRKDAAGKEPPKRRYTINMQTGEVTAIEDAD